MANTKMPLARINYFGPGGTVVETEYFYEEEQFLKTLRERNYYGVPMSVDLFRDADGNRISADFIRDLDPPILGVYIKDWEEE